MPDRRIRIPPTRLAVRPIAPRPPGRTSPGRGSGSEGTTPAGSERPEPAVAPGTVMRDGVGAIDPRVARAAALRAALRDPEVPFSSVVPPEITDRRARAEHLGLVIRAHVRLREKAAYDLGMALRELVTLKDVYGAKNLPELVENADLPMSHMTATKHMAVAAFFDRATAIAERSEKCYALVQYAHATGRAPSEAQGILERDEVLRPTSVRAKAATGVQVKAAVKALKKPKRAVPDAELEEAAESAEKLARELGFTGATGHVDDRGRIQLTIPLRTVLQARAKLPEVIARWAKKQAKAQPAWMTKVMKGWKPKLPVT